MEFANPLGLLALALAIPVLATHILAPRRTELEVSSTLLWQRMEKPVTASAPWQRLTPSWLLLVQLLVVTVLALLLANPVRVSPATLADHTVFLIDASGSMNSIDGEPDRLADARDRARQVRAELGDQGVASVIEVGPVPRMLLTTSADPAEFSEAIARVRPSGGAVDFAGAFALAEGLETPDRSIGFVLVSDGGLSDAELRLVPTGLTYERVGSMDTNRAITDLSVAPGPDGLTTRVTVAHTGGPAATQTLRLDVDGRTEHRAELDLDRGDRAVIEVTLPAGDRVDAWLDDTDLLAADNARHAVTSRRSELSVTVVGVGDPFLLAMLESLDGVNVNHVAALDPDPGQSDQSDQSGATLDPRPDVYVFDQIPVPDSVDAPFLAIAPPGGVTGVEVGGTVEAPAIALVRTDDSLLRGLDLSGVGIVEAQRIETVGADLLVGAEAAPLLVRGRHANRPFVYLAFAVSASNLPLDVGFPVLGDRLVTDLGGAALPPADLVLGQRVRATSPTATITDPAGNTHRVEPGTAAPVAELTGYWTIEPDDGPTQVVAVNADPAESTLQPAAAVPSAVRVARPGTEPARDQESLRPQIALVLLSLLAVEWMLSRRQVGVSRRQWRAATVLRVLIAAALVATLMNPGWWRSANQVAVVFVVDASDSLGAGGRAESFDWVRDALATQPDDTTAGVVLFGGDARIEALVQSELDLGRPSVRIDPTRTNLAAALRMGGAIVPDDARRRVVLISDGRANRGDVRSEVTALAQAGIVVDVRLVGATGDPDAAVTKIDAPARAHAGDAVPVTASVWVDDATEALVTLRRDSIDIEQRAVALESGVNSIRFVDPSPPAGRHRYEVEVAIGNDAQPANNRAFGSVEVGDDATVLVVEGTPGSAQVLADALAAGGLVVDTARPGAIAGIDDLAGYEATVLVDVSADDLTPAQMSAVTKSVRDAGQGLVTIGGTSSYGLGGWLGSELETVVPVISDVLDPRRRRSVAQVLAIDTSGSMGACHCAEGAMGVNRETGGVNKTDIAKAGAARAIGALSDQDQVGVLAVDTANRWVIDLQPIPDSATVSDGLGRMFPDGGTNLANTLETAAEQLRGSDRNTKHIVLFSDGFTEPGVLRRVAAQAQALLAEGITTSVIATGEGAADDLRPIAEAGGGRFYPGRDLARIPELLMEETVQASRSFLVEGEFLPVVTSADPVVAQLTAAPPVLGYLATTAKPTATTLLAVGEDADPLLVTWRVGLGSASAWTSDGGLRWAQTWTEWEGAVDFWGRVVRATFAASDGSVKTLAQVDGDILRIEIDAEQPFAPGSVATARVAVPGGESIEVALDRVGDRTFAAEIQVEGQGVYLVGSSVVSADPDAEAIVGRATAARSYSTEYQPGRPDVATMNEIAAGTGGRQLLGDRATAEVFDPEGLIAGARWFPLTGWLVWFGVLAWPLAVALARIVVRRGPESRSSPSAAERNAALQLRSRGRTEEGAGPAPAARRDEPVPDLAPPGSARSEPSPPQPTPNPAATDDPTNPHPNPGEPQPTPNPAATNDPTNPHPNPGEGSTLDALLAARRRRRDQ